jgi:hypothetical protein
MFPVNLVVATRIATGRRSTTRYRVVQERRVRAEFLAFCGLVGTKENAATRAGSDFKTGAFNRSATHPSVARTT